jgi:tripartite-type tricarboxylate transporter receptor subunit TctC
LVGSAPGGVADGATRIYAEVVSRSLGQPVVVEMRPGGGVAAAVAVTLAKPDGYTLLMYPGSQMATVPAMQKVPYDPLTAFSSITYLFDNVSILTVPASSPVKTAAELLEYGKKKKGGLVFGSQSFGVPPHLLAERIASETNTPMVFVQYRGGAPMMVDLLAGRLDFALPSYTAAIGYYASNKLRALAVDSDRRLPVLPDVPTLKEAGIRQEIARWFGIAAPTGTPPEIIAKLNAEFVKASKDPEVDRRLEQSGIVVRVGTPQEMDKSLRDETIAMKKLVEKLHLKRD